MVKKSKLLSTSSRVKMTVLCPSGLVTTSANLTRIWHDCINAEHQIDGNLRSKLLSTHSLTIVDWILDKHLTILTEVSLEMGMGFSVMDDKVFLPSRDYDDGSLKPALLKNPTGTVTQVMRREILNLHHTARPVISILCMHDFVCIISVMFVLL